MKVTIEQNESGYWSVLISNNGEFVAGMISDSENGIRYKQSAETIKSLIENDLKSVSLDTIIDRYGLTT